MCMTVTEKILEVHAGGLSLISTKRATIEDGLKGVRRNEKRYRKKRC